MVYQGHLGVLEQELKQVEEDRKSMREEAESLRRELAQRQDLEAELTRLKARLAATTAEAEVSAAALSEANRRQEDALAQVRSLTYDLDQSRRSSDSEKALLMGEASRFESEAREALESRDKAHSGYLETTSQLMHLQERFDDTETRLVKTERQAKRDAAAIVECEKELEEAVERASRERHELTLLLNETRQSEEILKREVEDLRRRVPGLQRQLDESNTRAAATRSELLLIEASLRDAPSKAELQRAEQTLGELREENQRLQIALAAEPPTAPPETEAAPSAVAIAVAEAEARRLSLPHKFI